jgi:hypothetical protein
MSNPSILAPLGMAFETVRRVLFRPFNPLKWFALGFTAWLAVLERGVGAGFHYNPLKCARAGAAQYGGYAWEWIMAHLLIVVPLFIIVAAGVILVVLLILWASYRGKFMFLDNVVWNRAEMVEPWKRFRVQGNSCFLFSICFWLAQLALIVLGAGLLLLMAWPDISRSYFGLFAVTAIGVGVLFMLCFVIAVVCIKVFLEDFIIPIMAVKECRIMEGWSTFFDLFREHAGIFTLYLLFRVALAVVIGIVTILLCCLLCCTVLLPYIGTVILLPVHVFLRSYSIHFLGQFDDKLRMFSGGQSAYIKLSSGKTEEIP